MKHIESNGIKNLATPGTEIVMVHFPSDISASEKDAAIAALRQILNEQFEKCDDVGDIEYGWGVENSFPVKVNGQSSRSVVEDGAGLAS